MVRVVYLLLKVQGFFLEQNHFKDITVKIGHVFSRVNPFILQSGLVVQQEAQAREALSV